MGSLGILSVLALVARDAVGPAAETVAPMLRDCWFNRTAALPALGFCHSLEQLTRHGPFRASLR